MPHPRQPLPSALQGEAFTVAQGRSIGLGQTRLRGRDLAKPFRGIRVQSASRQAGTPDQELLDRCAALLVAIPEGAFFSHVTAARLWPLPLPQSSAAAPIHVSVPAPGRPPRRVAVAGHLVKDPLVGVVRRHGLPLVDPETLFCQLSTQLCLADLVAAGDALVLRPVYQDQRDDERPWVSLPRLKERVELFRGRGKRAAAGAVDLVRPGAESRPETLLRLAIRQAGLPEPEVNVELRDTCGRFLGRADLVYRQWRVIVEYDGDQHRTSTRQFDHDVIRLEGFARAGWSVVRIVGRSFWADRDACVARIRGALIEGGWRA
jgi:very-short-patch-repair endonuclease